jgi:hypothetical protein
MLGFSKRGMRLKTGFAEGLWRNRRSPGLGLVRESQAGAGLIQTHSYSYSCTLNAECDKESQTTAGNDSNTDGFAVRLLLALRPRYGTPGRATELSDNPFLLVFGQVLDQQVVSPLQFWIPIDLF